MRIRWFLQEHRRLWRPKTTVTWRFLNLNWRFIALISLFLKRRKNSSFTQLRWDWGALFTTSPLWGLSPRGCSPENRLNNSLLMSTIRFSFSSSMMSSLLILILVEAFSCLRCSLLLLFSDTVPSVCGGYLGIEEGKRLFTVAHFRHRFRSFWYSTQQDLSLLAFVSFFLSTSWISSLICDSLFAASYCSLLLWYRKFAFPSFAFPSSQIHHSSLKKLYINTFWKRAFWKNAFGMSCFVSVQTCVWTIIESQKCVSEIRFFLEKLLFGKVCLA